VPVLAQAFWRAFLSQTPKRALLGSDAIARLCRHRWTGNVRELYNLIRRAVVFCEGSQVLPTHLSSQHELPAAAQVPANFRVARALALNAFERRYVEDMLRRHHGNVTRAAAEAGKDRRVFGRLIKRLQIDRARLGMSLQSPTVGRRGPTRSD